MKCGHAFKTRSATCEAVDTCEDYVKFRKYKVDEFCDPCKHPGELKKLAKQEEMFKLPEFVNALGAKLDKLIEITAGACKEDTDIADAYNIVDSHGNATVKSEMDRILNPVSSKPRREILDSI